MERRLWSAASSAWTVVSSARVRSLKRRHLASRCCDSQGVLVIADPVLRERLSSLGNVESFRT